MIIAILEFTMKITMVEFVFDKVTYCCIENFQKRDPKIKNVFRFSETTRYGILTFCKFYSFLYFNSFMTEAVII